jgi:hypothetical protein
MKMARRRLTRLTAATSVSMAVVLGLGPVGASAASTASAAPPRICYDVFDKTDGWRPKACDNQLVVAPNGIAALNVTLQGAPGISVAYQAYYAGAWQPGKQDGGQVGDMANVFTAVRIQLSPKNNNSSVRYQAIDKNFTLFLAADSQPAGNTTDDLRVIAIRYRQ